MSEKELCLSLLNADSEEQVVELLQTAGYWNDRDAWRYFGDNENNWSTIGNQQSSPHAALVEKLVNAVDATLMGKCFELDVQPDANEAPRSMQAAVAQFFDLKKLEDDPTAGLIRNWLPTKRKDVAQTITLVATGSKSKPCFTIVDQGEGQTPDGMPDTLLSLAKSNKLRIPFVQGKFNMGGTGVFKFCGRQNLQLVISKRNPKALSSVTSSAAHWGFTVVRREDPERGRRSSAFTYLAPVGKDIRGGRGGVLHFASDELPLFPEFSSDERCPYKRMTKWGTAIKLYEYSLPSGARSNILLSDGLLRRTDLLLPDTALPIRFYEAREFSGKSGSSFENTLTGLSVRLDDDKNNNLEDGFPTTCPLAAGGEQMIATIYAFKKGKASSYRTDEGIVFTVNGQTHGHLTPDFFRRKNVGLSYLSDSLLVVVDCSKFSGRAREDLFMNSRDRLSKGDLRGDVESELQEMLKTHQGLRDLKERRRREETEARLADSKPLEEMLESILQRSPSLANLFLLGTRASNPFKTKETGTSPKPYEGKKFPTYFKFRGRDYGTVLEREAHINMRCRVAYETDASNDYFRRALDPGTFKLFLEKDGEQSLVSNYSGPNLNNGIGTLSVKLPDDVQVGQQLLYVSTVEDEFSQQPFEHRFLVTVKEESKPGEGKGKRKRPADDEDGKERESSAGIVLPNIIKVNQQDWEQHGFTKVSALIIKDAGTSDIQQAAAEGPRQFDFFVNVDNVYLKSEMKQPKADAQLLEARYVYGLVLIGLGLIQQDIEQAKLSHSLQGSDESGNEDRFDAGDSSVEENVALVTEALSPVLLPMIDSLGALDIDDLDVGNPSGEAT